MSTQYLSSSTILRMPPICPSIYESRFRTSCLRSSCISLVLSCHQLRRRYVSTLILYHTPMGRVKQDEHKLLVRCRKSLYDIANHHPGYDRYISCVSLS